MLRSKNGTYLIEAAVVFPMIILTLITVVLIVMYFYQCSACQSDMHKFLRYEAGSSAGKKVYYSYDAKEDFSAEYSRNSIAASKDISMMQRGILFSRGNRTVTGTIKINDGVRYVLRRQLIND